MSDLSATPGLYSARPAISIDGSPSDPLTGGLTALLVEETTEGLYRCEATFGNWGTRDGRVDYLYFDRRTLEFGKELAVSAGAAETAGTLFKGRITGLEGRFPQSRPPEILVLAEDRLQDLRMTRRTRTFENVTDADLFRQVAGEHGLTADVDVDGPGSHRVLAQVNQSDLAFLRDRARAIDAELWVEGDSLHVQSRNKRRGAEVTLTFGQRLRECAILADLAGQRTALTVAGWDVGAKQGIAVAAEDAAIQGELGGLTSGSQVLRRALGERKEQLVHTAPLSDADARSYARAAFRTAARRFLTGAGLAEGDARIKVGARITLQGLGPLFDGAYYVAEVRHLFDNAHGFRTHFRVERPGIGG